MAATAIHSGAAYGGVASSCAAQSHPAATSDPTAPPPVLNAFLTWLNSAPEAKIAEWARAFHVNAQLAGCTIPNFPHGINGTACALPCH